MTKDETLYYHALKSGDWSHNQKRIIKALNEWGNTQTGPAKCTDIEKAANVGRAYVQMLLKPLEKLGYITVLRDHKGQARKNGCILVNDWSDQPRYR